MNETLLCVWQCPSQKVSHFVSNCPDACACRQGGCRAPLEDGGRGVPAAGRVQRPPGCWAGGPAPARPHANRIHPEPEGCPYREGEEAGSEYWWHQCQQANSPTWLLIWVFQGRRFWVLSFHMEWNRAKKGVKQIWRRQICSDIQSSRFHTGGHGRSRAPFLLKKERLIFFQFLRTHTILFMKSPFPKNQPPFAIIIFLLLLLVLLVGAPHLPSQPLFDKGMEFKQDLLVSIL